MEQTPSYGELKEKVQQLEQEVFKHKRNQKKLQESEARFRDIANNALEWIWEVDQTGKYTYSSPMVKKILGYEPEEIIGRHFYDFFHPDDTEGLMRLASKTFAHKKAFREFINRNVCKEGRTVFLSTSGVPILNVSGQLVGYRGADTDITDQYLAREALQESEEHLKSLMESASGFVVFRLGFTQASTHKLRVIFASPSIEDILGIPEPDNFETWFDYVHPDDLDRVATANQRAFETLRFDQEFRTYHPQKKEWRWIHAISTGGIKGDGWNGYVNGIMIDTTDKQNIYERLMVRGRELEKNTRDLKQMNTALNVLLNKREEDKLSLRNKTAANIKQLVLPYLSKMKKSNLESEQLALIDIITSNINDITASFSHYLSSKYINLTPTEIRVADLVRQSQTTKQIAHILCLSPKTVESHRDSIRKKLGLKKKKINLKSYLLAIK